MDFLQRFVDVPLEAAPAASAASASPMSATTSAPLESLSTDELITRCRAAEAQAAAFGTQLRALRDEAASSSREHGAYRSKVAAWRAQMKLARDMDRQAVAALRAAAADSSTEGRGGAVDAVYVSTLEAQVATLKDTLRAAAERSARLEEDADARLRAPTNGEATAEESQLLRRRLEERDAECDRLREELDTATTRYHEAVVAAATAGAAGNGETSSPQLAPAPLAAAAAGGTSSAGGVVVSPRDSEPAPQYDAAYIEGLMAELAAYRKQYGTARRKDVGVQCEASGDTPIVRRIISAGSSRASASGDDDTAVATAPGGAVDGSAEGNKSGNSESAVSTDLTALAAEAAAREAAINDLTAEVAAARQAELQAQREAARARLDRDAAEAEAARVQGEFAAAATDVQRLTDETTALGKRLAQAKRESSDRADALRRTQLELEFARAAKNAAVATSDVTGVRTKGPGGADSAVDLTVTGGARRGVTITIDPQQLQQQVQATVSGAVGLIRNSRTRPYALVAVACVLIMLFSFWQNESVYEFDANLLQHCRALLRSELHPTPAATRLASVNVEAGAAVLP